MATIDGKPSRRRPGYTPQDVKRAQEQQRYTPRRSSGGKVLDQTVRDRNVVDIADALLREPGIDEGRDR